LGANLYAAWFYRRGNRSPVEDFIASLAEKEQVILKEKIELHLRLGIALTFPHTRQIRGCLWELRVKANGRFIRLFYFIRKHKIIYLHGVTKSRKKHHLKDIETAINRMHDLSNGE
jgi:phage-related protein